MIKKFAFFLEMLWLVLSIACLGAAIHQTVMKGMRVSYTFYLMALICGLMYYIRRKRRKETN